MNNNNNNPNFVNINQITNMDMYQHQININNYDETTRPMGIDLKNFLPKEQTIHAISEKNDLPIIEEVLSQNQNFKTIIAGRIQSLKTVSSIWSKGNKNEALQAINVLKDLGVSNDIFNFGLLKTDINRVAFRSDDAIVALPAIITLVSSQYDIYFKNGVLSAWVLLKLFYDVIISTKNSQAIGGGIDLNREEKIRKYDVIINYFTQIRNLSSLSSHLNRQEQIEGLNLQKFVAELDYFLKKCQQY